jgi:hypothetical protein
VARIRTRGEGAGTAHGRVCGHARDTHTHPAGLRTITHESVRHAQPQHTVTVVGHTGYGKVITICDKLGSTQSQVAVAGRSRRHTHPAHEHESHEHGHESYGTDHESYRSRHESHSAYANRTGTGTRTQVAADSHSYRAQAQGAGAQVAADRVTREQAQEQGSAQVPARSTQPRAGAGQEQEQAWRSQVTARRTRHDTTERHGTRHDTIRYTRYDTIPIHTIRYDHARYTRDARDRQQVTHTIRM